MYLGQGIFWARSLRPVDDRELNIDCDCGQPVAPYDFLCSQCREEFEEELEALYRFEFESGPSGEVDNEN